MRAIMQGVRSCSAELRLKDGSPKATIGPKTSNRIAPLTKYKISFPPHLIWGSVLLRFDRFAFEFDGHALPGSIPKNCVESNRYSEQSHLIESRFDGLQGRP